MRIHCQWLYTGPRTDTGRRLHLASERVMHPPSRGCNCEHPVRVRVRVCKCVCDPSFKMPVVMALLCALLVSVLLEKLKL